MRAIVLAGSLALVAAGGKAAAEKAITLEQSVGYGPGSGTPAMLQTIEIASDRLKIISPGTETIFRGDQNTLWVVHPANKTYYETNSESLRQEESASFGREPGVRLVTPQFVYEKNGSRQKIRDFTCTPFHVTMTGQPSADLCVAPLSDLGLSRDDLKSFIDFNRFMGQVASTTGIHPSPSDLDAIRKQIGFDAYPVQMILYGQGHPMFYFTLISIKHEEVPGTAFDLPAGYTRREPHGSSRPSDPPG